MSTFLFWTWPILLFFAVAAIKGIFGKPRIKPGYAGFAEQEKRLINNGPYSPSSIDMMNSLNPTSRSLVGDE